MRAKHWQNNFNAVTHGGMRKVFRFLKKLFNAKLQLSVGNNAVAVVKSKECKY